VGNDSGSVFIEVQGPAGALDRFAARLRSDAPPLATVREVVATEIPTVPADPAGGEPTAPAAFHIVDSHTADAAATPVPPDVAICDNCVAELFDPADRRYRHPFITCTDCGPRFTIIKALPYDRPATTMADFPMC